MALPDGRWLVAVGSGFVLGIQTQIDYISLYCSNAQQGSPLDEVEASITMMGTKERSFVPFVNVSLEDLVPLYNMTLIIVAPLVWLAIASYNCLYSFSVNNLELIVSS